jgi:Flp pilus assembly protein TadD
MNFGDEPTQLRQLRELLQRRPDDGIAWLALAQLLARRPPGAELHHALEQAIRSNPDSIDTWVLAARVHRQQHGLAAAQRWLAHWSRQYPALTAPRQAATLLQAETAREAGQWQEALALYREIEKSHKLDPLTLNDIGSCLASLERYEDAERHFRTALRLHPQFPEAQLNLAFLQACQGRDDAALQQIGEVLEDYRAGPGTRHGAQVLQAMLREHARLGPLLEQAVRSRRIGDLQAALDATPDLLARPHEDTVMRLRRVAEGCRSLATGKPADLSDDTDRVAARRVEAAILCNLEGGAAALAKCSAQLEEAPADPAEQRFRIALDVLGDRDDHEPADLCGPFGEAWLRYWHARLLAGEPGKRPGQFKLSANAIRDLPLTPPEHVAASLRLALRELAPALPLGAARGLFLYVAVNMIHGFGDGNGRLARFLLAWETGQASVRPLLVPLGARAAVARALDIAWLEGDAGPLEQAIRQASGTAEQAFAGWPAERRTAGPAGDSS